MFIIIAFFLVQELHMHMQYIYNPCTHTTSEWVCICDLCGCILLYLFAAVTFLLRHVIFFVSKPSDSRSVALRFYCEMFLYGSKSPFSTAPPPPIQILSSGLFGTLPFPEQFIILPFKAAGSWNPGSSCMLSLHMANVMKLELLHCVSS